MIRIIVIVIYRISLFVYLICVQCMFSLRFGEHQRLQHMSVELFDKHVRLSQKLFALCKYATNHRLLCLALSIFASASIALLSMHVPYTCKVSIFASIAIRSIQIVICCYFVESLAIQFLLAILRATDYFWPSLGKILTKLHQF